MPEVTFIIPAYNAASYLRSAVESVLAQSVTDWRMVIVDDCSSDATPEIADAFAAADGRIRVIHNPAPSGSAYRARLAGIRVADTSLIAPLDADDLLPPAYLEELMKVRVATGAYAVYPLIHLHEPSGSVPFLDPSTYPIGSVLNGREAFRFTLDGWRVTCNGGLIDRATFLEGADLIGADLRDAHADETHTRRLLLLLRSVAFTAVPYLYRINPGSVTHAPSIRRLEILRSCIDVQEMTLRHFPEESEECSRAHAQLYHTYFDCLRMMHSGRFRGADRRKGIAMLREARRHIDIARISTADRGRLLPLLYPLPPALSIPLYGAYRALRK